MQAGIKEAIYFYLNMRSANRDEITDRLQQLTSVLEEPVGSGASVVEKLIVKIYTQRAGTTLEAMDRPVIGVIAGLQRCHRISRVFKQEDHRQRLGETA